MKSAFCAGRPPTWTSGPAAWAAVADAIERVLAGLRRVVSGREREHLGHAAGAPLGALRRNRAVDALHRVDVGGDPVGARALGQDLVRKQRPGADPGVLKRRQALLRVTLLGDRVRGLRRRASARSRRRSATPRIATAAPAAIQRRRTTSSAHRVQALLARLSSVRRCGQSSRCPNFDSTTGSSVIATSVETSGISSPPIAHAPQERAPAAPPSPIGRSRRSCR